MEITGPFGIPMPPEMVEEMQRQYDLAQMRGDSYRHDIHSILNGMTEQQLRFVNHIMHGIAESNSLEQLIGLASWYEGVIAGVLKMNFNICPACGIDHDKVAEQMAAEGGDGATPDKEPEALDMNDYNLEPADGNTLRCKGCGMIYSSIQDRALRKSDKSGCPGCVQKEKWG